MNWQPHDPADISQAESGFQVWESLPLSLSFFLSFFSPSNSGLFKQVNDLSDRDNPLTLGLSFMSGLFVFSEHNVFPLVCMSFANKRIDYKKWRKHLETI